MTSQGRGEGVYKADEKDKVTKDVRYGRECVCNAMQVGRRRKRGDVEETGDGRRENEGREEKWAATIYEWSCLRRKRAKQEPKTHGPRQGSQPSDCHSASVTSSLEKILIIPGSETHGSGRRA